MEFEAWQLQGDGFVSRVLDLPSQVGWEGLNVEGDGYIISFIILLEKSPFFKKNFFCIILCCFHAVKVLVFLTMPIDPASDNIPQQIEYLWSLKEAVTRNVTIAVIVSLLEDPLEHLER